MFCRTRRLQIFFFSNAVGDAISCQTNAAGSAVGHAFSRRKKNLICSSRFECLISHCLHGGAYVRTLYGRSDGSDVITKPKFLALMGLPKSLSYGAPLARALRRARELGYQVVFYLIFRKEPRPIRNCFQHSSPV